MADDAPVLVAGGGIAGLAAAVGLAERGVRVVLVEPEAQLGGRVRAWPVDHGGDPVTMSRGFHAFFRQYYNLRGLLRRVPPAVEHQVPLTANPQVLARGLPGMSRGLLSKRPWCGHTRPLSTVGPTRPGIRRMGIRRGGLRVWPCG